MKFASKIAVVLSTTSLLLFSAPTALAQDTQAPENSITWGITPVPDEDTEDADTRVSFRFEEVAPGETITDEVLVSNYSQQDLVFALAASDGVISDEGLFELLPPEETPEGTGAWIEIEPEVAVPAGEAVAVPFSITVPDDALPGDQPGGITAGLVSTEDSEQVTFNAVVGTRIHLRVDGEILPQVSIQDVNAGFTPSWNPFAPGVLELQWQIENTGNVRLGAQQLLSVEGLFGLDSGIAEQVVASQREILPGQLAQAQVELQAWPLGLMHAQLVSQQSLVAEDEIDAEPQSASAVTAILAVPWAQLVLLLVIVSVIGGIIWSRRRNKKAIAQAVAAAKSEITTDASPGTARQQAAQTSGTAVRSDHEPVWR